MNPLPLIAALFLFASLGVAIGQNRVCIAPDNGTGTIDWPAQCPYGNSTNLIEVGTANGELVELEIDIPPMLMTCLPGNPPRYDSGITGGGAAIAIPAFIKYLKQSKTAEARVDLLLSVRNTPRSAQGADVQIFDTEIISMDLQLPGVGNADYRVLSCVAQPGGTGRTTITRLPTGDFTVDSFFDVTYQINIEGAPGGLFEGDVIDTTASVRLSQTSSRFNGVSYRPLDGAVVTQTGGKLKISNLGSSGCDGVSVAPGGGGGGKDNDCDSLLVSMEPCVAGNDLFGDGEVMSMFPFPPPPLDLPDLPNLPSSMVFTNTGGTVSAVCSSGGLGATEWVVEVYNGSNLQAVAVVADGSEGYSVPQTWFVADSFSFGVEREMKESGEKGGTADINIGIGELQRTSMVCSVGAAGEVTLPGNPTPVVGDRVVCSPRDPQILPRVTTSLEVRSSSSSGFCVADVAVEKFNMRMRGLDEAAVSCRNGNLVVSNIGSSGCDGVSIDLGEGEAEERLPIRIELAPVDVGGAGGSFFTSGHIAAGGTLIESEYRAGGGSGGSVWVSTSPTMRTCRVTVRNGGVDVGEFDVPLTPGVQNRVCEVGDAASGAPPLSGCGKRAIGWPWDLSCLVQEFDRPVPITPTGGPPLIGDEVLLLLPDATPADVAALRTVQLRASGIPRFEVCGAGMGSTPAAPVLTAEDHADFDYPGTGSRMVDSVPKYYTTDSGETICIFSSLTDLVEVADNGGLKEYTATLRLEIQGINGFAFARSVELPGTFTIQHGPNPFSGQDVQQFGTQVRSCLFTLPPGDPDFAQLRVSGGLDLGFGSPGDVKITKIPECVFIYDEIQKILGTLTLAGTPGGGLSGGRIINEPLEQNLHVTRPLVLFGGSAHLASGGADLRVDAGGRLQVSNIGSSGCDGVSIDLVGTEAFEVNFDPLSPPEFLDGGTLSFEEFGDVRGGVVGSSLGDCVIVQRAAPGTAPFFDVTVDFSSVAPDSVTLQVLEGGVVVAQVPVAATSASYSILPGATGLPPIKGVGKLPGLSATPCKVIRWCDRGLFTFAGQAPVSCDEVRMLAHGVPYESISRFDLRASDEVDHCIVIEEELRGYFGRKVGVLGTSVRVEGQAHRASAHRRISPIRVSNLGSSGLDGVSIAPPGGGSSAPHDLPMVIDVNGVDLGAFGSSMEIKGHGGAIAGIAVGCLLQNSGGSEVEVSSDFSAIGNSQVRLKLFTNDNRVSENPLYCGREVYNSVLADGAPLCYLKYKLDRCFVKSWSMSGDADDRPAGGEALYHHKIVCTFCEPIEVETLDGGPPIEATRMEISVVNPTSPATDLSSVHLLGADLKPFSIGGISTGPTFPHGLPMQSVGSSSYTSGGGGGGGRVAIVSNIGSSGQDGVGIDIGEGEGVWQTWEPVDLASSGGSMTVMSSKRRLSESMERRVKTTSPRSSLRVDHEPFVFFDIILMVDPGGDGPGSGVSVGTEVICLDANGGVLGRYPIHAQAGEPLRAGSLEPVDPTGSGRIVGSGYLPPNVIEGGGYLGQHLCIEFEETMRFTPDGGGVQCECTHLIVRCCDDDCDDDVDDICGSTVLCSTFSGIPEVTKTNDYLYAFGGRVFSTLGGARFDACRANSFLPIDNIGSSGQDGVRHGGPTGSFQTEIVALDLRSAQPIVTGLPPGEPVRGVLIGGEGFVDGIPSSLGQLALPLDSSEAFVELTADFSIFDPDPDNNCTAVFSRGERLATWMQPGATGAVAHCYAGGASVVGVCRLDERAEPGGGQLGPGYCIKFDRLVEITPPGGAPGTGVMGDCVEVRAGRPTGSWQTEILSMDLTGSVPPDRLGEPLVCIDSPASSGEGPPNFGAWLVENFTPAEIALLDAAGYCLDIDGDGFCEVEEFVFGLDPHVFDSLSNKPQISSDTRVGPTGEREEFMRVSYEFDPTLAGVDQELGVSTDLVEYDFEFVSRLLEHEGIFWRLTDEEELPSGNRRVTYELIEPLSASQRKFVKFKAGADLSKKVN